MSSKRVCQIIRVRPERFEEYCQVHDAVWPGVLAALKKAHFTDYSIHHDPVHSLLIATFRYTGSDWDADMEEVARDEETRRWWKMTDGMQESLVEGAKGSGEEGGWWLDLKEVFRTNQGDERDPGSADSAQQLGERGLSLSPFTSDLLVGLQSSMGTERENLASSTHFTHTIPHEFKFHSISWMENGHSYHTLHFEEHYDRAENWTHLGERVPLDLLHTRIQPHFTAAPLPLCLETTVVKPPAYWMYSGPEGTMSLPRLQLGEVEVCEVLRRNPHPNVAEYLGYTSDDGVFMKGLFFKRYPRTLEDLVEKREEEVDVEWILRGVRAAVEHLHSLGIIHGDVHPGNIMLDVSSNPIPIDFDSSKPEGTLFEDGDKRGVFGCRLEEAVSSEKEND